MDYHADIHLLCLIHGAQGKGPHIPRQRGFCSFWTQRICLIYHCCLALRDCWEFSIEGEGGFYSADTSSASFFGQGDETRDQRTASTTLSTGSTAKSSFPSLRYRATMVNMRNLARQQGKIWMAALSLALLRRQWRRTMYLAKRAGLAADEDGP